MKHKNAKIHARRAYLKNRDKIIARVKAYYALNAEAIKEKHRVSSKYRAYRKRVYDANPEHFRAKARAYYSANRLKCLEASKSRNKKNRKRIRNYESYKRRTDVNFKLAKLLRDRLLSTVTLVHKKSSVLDLLGCSVSEARHHIELQFRPGMSWANHGDWEIDHVKPCSKFDLTLISEQAKCFHFSNLQPLWKSENRSKKDRIMIFSKDTSCISKHTP